jgi:putative endonuclease
MTPKASRDRKRAHGLGLFAEHVAEVLTRLKGYRILARRYAVKEGEIDLLARRGDTIAFVGVKVRPTLDEARTAIEFVKRRRVSRAARSCLASHPWAAPLAWRGGAIFVAPWRFPHARREDFVN